MRRVLRIRDARIFLFGWTLSQFGDWAMFIVLGVWMKDLTGSNSAAGLIFFALAAPSLFFVHDRSDVWLLYAVTVFYGFSGLLAGSARSALMTVIVPRDLLAEANGMFQTVREGLRLIAPLAGAGIYAAPGGGFVAVLDSVTFVAVVVAVLRLRTPEPAFERDEHHFIAEVLAGARHIVR